MARLRATTLFIKKHKLAVAQRLVYEPLGYRYLLIKLIGDDDVQGSGAVDSLYSAQLDV